MVPCIDDSIPVYVRNIFNPSFEGTVVQGRSPTLKETSMMTGKSLNWRAKKVSFLPNFLFIYVYISPAFLIDIHDLRVSFQSKELLL
jgi:aspartokinase